MVNKIFRKYEKECIHLVRIKIADLNDILASVDAGMKIVDRYEHFDQAYNQYVRNAMIDGNPPVGFEMYMDKYGFEDCAVELEDATQNAFEILSRVLGIKCVDYNTGCFNTEEQKIILFNKPSNMTYREWMDSDAKYLLNQIPKNVVEWVSEEDMTDEEKAAYPTYETTGGYLKVLDESKCGQLWWNGLSDCDKQIIKSIPNFDPDIFYECTGIKVN